ncbi:28S ribosomal protein S22, mitochondrial isoform X2 [Alosa alosa]|uniref:28S ribosomal protein S22, mitochondrial isoform X2 n=1 Tax=Alosa alosa TaxID=278164 RepID=UPI0020150D48|nr:28S ribosomal protein S22, mitochondrial isoform X2 [Alosa alosa]
MVAVMHQKAGCQPPYKKEEEEEEEGPDGPPLDRTQATSPGRKRFRSKLRIQRWRHAKRVTCNLPVNRKKKNGCLSKMAALAALRGLARCSPLFRDASLFPRAARCGAGRSLCSAVQGNDAVSFSDPEVQELLKNMTGCDVEKVFRPVQHAALKPPTYKLLTDQQLQEAVEQARRQAEELLRMPPELEERALISDLLSHDAILEGVDSAKLIFTDITLNVPHRERFMVVREPSGALRKASWEERDRILQIYFPKDGRKLTPSALFQEDNLKMALSEDRHEEVLRRSLVQFEPDAAQYKRVQRLVFEDVERSGKFDLLRSTRFFGGLVWYLTTAKRIDTLLLHMLHRDLLQDAVCLVRLFHLLHPQCESAKQAQHTHATGLELLKLYGEMDSQRRGVIELALQTYEQAAALSTA